MFNNIKRIKIQLIALAIAQHLCFAIQPLKAEKITLTQSEIEQQIKNLPQWRQQNKTITRAFKFKNFVEAIAFVNQIVKPAEAAAHHPDLAISYNKVTVSLTNHDAGGLTQQDFDLAKTISQLVPLRENNK